MQPTSETSRQADRLTDRDRRRCSDQALPCLTISLRQLGLPLISILINSFLIGWLWSARMFTIVLLPDPIIAIAEHGS